MEEYFCPKCNRLAPVAVDDIQTVTQNHISVYMKIVYFTCCRSIIQVIH